MTRTCPPTDLGHKDNPYRAGNSFRFLAECRDNGKEWVDQDAQESADHTLWNMHWPWLYQDKFANPHGGPLLKRGRRRVSSLSDRQLAEVSSPDGYRPHKYVAMIAVAAGMGLNHEIELKVAASNDALRDLLARVASVQVRYPEYKVRVKILLGVLTKTRAINTLGRVKKIATEVGANVDTMLLNHKSRAVTLNAADRARVDLVRGKWRKV